MPNRVFVIADTHFGHKKVCSFESKTRPFSSVEEMNEEMVYRWNHVVKAHDIVWHLGDVLFGEHSFEILARLNGVKKLVMGNHDRYPMEKYLEHFSQVCSSVRLRECIFTHIPVHPAQFHRYLANIHGYLHSHTLDDPRYINVSCEQSNLAPQLLDTVMLKVPVAR